MHVCLHVALKQVIIASFPTEKCWISWAIKPDRKLCYSKELEYLHEGFWIDFTGTVHLQNLNTEHDYLLNKKSKENAAFCAVQMQGVS